MTAPRCSCPACHLFFAPDAAAGEVVCPVCDTRFTPGTAPAVANPPPAAAPAPNLPARLIAGAVFLAAIALGLGAWLPSRTTPPPPAVDPAPVTNAQPQSFREEPNTVEPPAPAPSPPPAPVPARPAARPPRRPAPPTRLSALAVRVNRAIERGLAYLRKHGQTLQLPTQPEGLLGLTLLECGVPAADPLVARIAVSLRAQAEQMDRTYELSTTIFFLDRLGKRQDDGLIRTLAGRLAAGQNQDGTWTYRCEGKRWPHGTGDHSNTQFATLALWVARRHGAGPEVREALKQVEEHYRDVQAVDGSWAYLPPHRKAKPRPVPLAAAPRGTLKPQTLDVKPWVAGRKAPWTVDSRRSYTGFDDGKARPPSLGRLPPIRPNPPPRFPRPQEIRPFPDPDAGVAQKAQAAKGKWRVSNSCGGLLALAVGHGLAPRPSARPLNDPAVAAGLTFLGKAVSGEVPLPVGSSGRLLDGRDDLYTLWSVERVGTLYSLQRLGKREWYPWAAEWIVGVQRPDGEWRQGLGPVVDTCFALLVLRRSNLAPDLTYALTGPKRSPSPVPPKRVKQDPSDDPRTRSAPPQATEPGAGPAVTHQPPAGPQHGLPEPRPGPAGVRPETP